MRKRCVALVLGLGGLAGCAVGPDFHAPEAPASTRYTTTPLPPETVAAEVAGGASQHLVGGRDVPAEWWKLFESEALDGLVRQALADSPVLAQATAKLARAQQDLKAHKGSTQIPKIDASFSGNRVDVQPESLGVPQLPIDTPFTLYAASVSVRYTLDLFGKSRRELEALQAKVDYERFEIEAAKLMLAGNVVTAAIEEASLRDQIATIETMLALQARMLEIMERREQLGGISKLDVETQRREVAQRRAELPPLQERLEQTRHRLAVYLGKLPGEAELPELALADLKLPTELPLSLPSELVRQRPDIQAAEALLHQASANVGVATANLYPQITLSGTAGSLTTALGDLFSSGTGFFFIGGSIAQHIFHGGELKAQKRSAEAAFAQAGAAYRETVLTGFQDVADTLAALDFDAKLLRERADAAAHAKTVYDITASRYDAGGVSLLAMLDAERQHFQASLDATRAAAERFADSAALFQALGGGWWTEEATGKPSSAPPPPSSNPTFR